MIDTTRPFEHITDPFQVHLAHDVMPVEVVRSLYAAAPLDRTGQIQQTDPQHEKQYKMNLLYLVRDGKPARDVTPDQAWGDLVTELLSDRFTTWLEAGVGLSLGALPVDIGMYTHVDGDFISVHKDKPNKAITAILYLNERWPAEYGGQYEVRASKDPAAEPVRRIPPRPGQVLAFPPTDRSWHSVSKVTTGGAATRLTVQLEYWFEDWETRHARRDA
jgi:Rps23 Pro-64 3,4-dihydroxylase Tpa1-like proline 4-hydroxylase